MKLSLQILYYRSYRLTNGKLSDKCYGEDFSPLKDVLWIFIFNDAR